MAEASVIRQRVPMIWQLLVLVSTLMLILVWQRSGADQWISSWVAGREGFALKNSPALSAIHKLTRVLYLAIPILLWRDFQKGQLRRTQLVWSLTTLMICVLTIAAIKQTSPVYCPWDLVRFGGEMPLQEPWQFSAERLGKCFPSGHAGGAFAGIVALLIYRDNGVSWRLLFFLTASLGALSGITQVLRGAHFVSHVWVSLWICSTIAVVSHALLLRWEARKNSVPLLSLPQPPLLREHSS